MNDRGKSFHRTNDFLLEKRRKEQKLFAVKQFID